MRRLGEGVRALAPSSCPKVFSSTISEPRDDWFFCRKTQTGHRCHGWLCRRWLQRSCKILCGRPKFQLQFSSSAAQSLHCESLSAELTKGEERNVPSASTFHRTNIDLDRRGISLLWAVLSDDRRNLRHSHGPCRRLNSGRGRHCHEHRHPTPANHEDRKFRPISIQPLAARRLRPGN